MQHESAKYSNYYLQQQKVWAVDGMLMSAINETVGIRGGLVVGVINLRRRNSGALARLKLYTLSDHFTYIDFHYEGDLTSSFALLMTS